jgi:uncharacterized membrane protein (DUF485 family)
MFPENHDPERAQLLRQSSFFAREERLAHLASYFAAIACAFALIFLSVAPWAGMRPFIVRLPGFWFRYSLIGDLVLLLASYRYASFARGDEALFPCILACLSLAHACTSWHDPWGIFFSNAFIEFLLFASIPFFLYSHLRSAAPLFARAGAPVYAFFLVYIAFASLFAHIFGLLGFAARSLPVRLSAALASGQYFMTMRWLVLLVSLAAIIACIYLIVARKRLDPELAQIRARVFDSTN